LFHQLKVIALSGSGTFPVLVKNISTQLSTFFRVLRRLLSLVRDWYHWKFTKAIVARIASIEITMMSSTSVNQFLFCQWKEKFIRTQKFFL